MVYFGSQWCYFPPPYQPHGVKMLYKGKPVDLTPEQEEVATMYAVMQDTEYILKDRFKENFWNDWQKLLGRNHVIQNLKDCDFLQSMTGTKALKEEKLKPEEKYMWAIVDDVKEKVGNFRAEPPGLFGGRGEDPKSQFYASIDDDVDEDIVIQEIALLLINFAANPKVEYFVEEPDDDQPFRPVDAEDLRVRVDILQEQLHALQDELREERRLRIQADHELYRLFHKP